MPQQLRPAVFLSRLQLHTPWPITPNHTPRWCPFLPRHGVCVCVVDGLRKKHPLPVAHCTLHTVRPPPPARPHTGHTTRFPPCVSGHRFWIFFSFFFFPFLFSFCVLASTVPNDRRFIYLRIRLHPTDRPTDRRQSRETSTTSTRDARRAPHGAQTHVNGGPSPRRCRDAVERPPRHTLRGGRCPVWSHTPRVGCVAARTSGIARRVAHVGRDRGHGRRQAQGARL